MDTPDKYFAGACLLMVMRKNMIVLGRQDFSEPAIVMHHLCWLRLVQNTLPLHLQPNYHSNLIIF